MTKPRIDRPALLVYAFAALDGDADLARSGWAALDDLWRACRVLGPSTEPLLGVSSPDYLPDPPDQRGPFRIIASARRSTPGRIRSVFVFTEHGTAGLVAAISADRDGAEGWADLVAAWRKTALASDILLGSATVLLGLSDDPVGTAALLAKGFGLNVDLPQADDGPGGALLWDVDRSDRSRVLVIAAPPPAESTVDAWAWTVDGSQGLTPLPRYLLNVFRAYHQQNLYEALRPLSDVITETDSAVTALARHLPTADDPGTPATELLAADRGLQQVRLGTTGLLWRLTKIQEMATGVHGIRVNTRVNRPEATVSGGMFDRDDKALTWFADQLDREATYLDTLVRRTEAVHATATAVIGTATTRRHERLTLLQTSFLGALLMALAAIQSLQYTTTIAPALKAPVIAVLASAAFGLPLLLARWTGLVPRHEPYCWPDLGAAAVFGGTLGWLGSAILWHTTSQTLAPSPATTLAILAGALALFVPTWLVSRRRQEHN